MSKIKLLNVNIDNLTLSEAVDEVDKLIKKKEPSYIVTPNVDHVVRLEEDLEFKKSYDNASLVLTDGMPLVWISKLKNSGIKERVCGSDLFPKVCELAAKKGYKVFLLGAAEGVAEIAAKNLKAKFNNLHICGIYSPKYGFEKSEVEINKIVNLVNESQPDILVLGLGTPKQEKFIYQYRETLKVPVTLAVGASIDFEAGKVKRAPMWMRKIGLEWFYRLCKEPKRMFKRYILTDLKIIKLIFKYR